MILILHIGYRMLKLLLWEEMTELAIKFGQLLMVILVTDALENSIKKMINQVCNIGELHHLLQT